MEPAASVVSVSGLGVLELADDAPEGGIFGLVGLRLAAIKLGITGAGFRRVILESDLALCGFGGGAGLGTATLSTTSAHDFSGFSLTGHPN